MSKKLKKCEICKEKVEELYKTDKGEQLCGDCFGDEFLKHFDETDDSLFEEAIKSGNVKAVKPETRPITIRLNVVDIQRAKKLANDKNVPYQTLLKEIIHKNLA